MGDPLIKTDVDVASFNKVAVDRVPMGTISVENGATISRMGMDGKPQTFEASVGDKVYKNDVIKTPSDGSVAIALIDKTMLSAGSSSTIDMSKWDIRPSSPAPEDNGIKRGSLSVISGKISKATPEGTRFSAPGMVLGVRG